MDTSVNAQLLKAARDGEVEQVRVLLQHPAVDVNTQDAAGWTSLIHASYHGHSRVVSLLISKEPNVEHPVRANGATALHLGCARGQLDVIEILIKEGKCNINVRDFDLATPLHAAVLGGHPRVVRFLLSENAQTLVYDKHGKCPAHWALQRSQMDMYHMLAQHTQGQQEFNSMPVISLTLSDSPQKSDQNEIITNAILSAAVAPVTISSTLTDTSCPSTTSEEKSRINLTLPVKPELKEISSNRSESIHEAIPDPRACKGPSQYPHSGTPMIPYFPPSAYHPKHSSAYHGKTHVPSTSPHMSPPFYPNVMSRPFPQMPLDCCPNDYYQQSYVIQHQQQAIEHLQHENRALKSRLHSLENDILSFRNGYNTELDASVAKLTLSTSDEKSCAENSREKSQECEDKENIEYFQYTQT